MKKYISCLVYIGAALIIINWGAKQKSIVSGDNLHRINFFGKIITVANQDKETKVDNISIENLIKQIPMYKAPTSKTDSIDPKKHIIRINPKDILPQKFFDLKEAGNIETKREAGNPVIWKYVEIVRNPTTGATSFKEKREYIEIIVSPPQDLKNKESKKNHYLVESRQLLRYNEVSPAGPIESKLNFKGLYKLTIEGYRDRELEQEALRINRRKTAKR